jgi:hypothetical protein
MVLQNLED